MASDVRAGLWRAVLLAAAGTLTCVALGLTSGYREPALLEEIVRVAVVFVLFLGALVLGGRRGLMLLWGLLLLLWAMLFGMAVLDHGGMTYTFHVLPDMFTAWSAAALPVGVATAVLLYRTREVRPGVLLGVMGVWMVLVAASTGVSAYPLDVGGAPRGNPLVAWLLDLLLPVAPFAVGGWMMMHVRRRAAPASVAMAVQE